MTLATSVTQMASYSDESRSDRSPLGYATPERLAPLLQRPLPDTSRGGPLLLVTLNCATESGRGQQGQRKQSNFDGSRSPRALSPDRAIVKPLTSRRIEVC